MLLVGSNRTTLLQALQSFPTATLFTGISNWSPLRTNLLSEPLMYGYIFALYPMECNVFYNAYNSITLVNMIKDVDNYNFILKALDIKLVLAGNILAMQKAIMTFINDLSLYLNPTQMNNLWNSLLGTYGAHKAELSLSELDLYGSKRLGVIEDTISLNKFHFTGNYNPINNNYNIISFYSPTYTAIPNYNLTSWTYGKKKYELTNHLGNVLSTVSDYKIPYLNTSGKLCYRADIRSENRYYAFGGMKDSGFVAGRKPRYAYQGSEINQELDGTFNTLYRQGDVDGLVWWSVDPKWYLTPWESPYSLMGGNPVRNTDVKGDILSTDGSKQASVDIKSIAGKYDKAIKIDINTNLVALDLSVYKNDKKFTDKKGQFNQNKWDKFEKKANKDIGVKLIKDLVSDKNKYLFGVGPSFDAIDPLSGNTVQLSFTSTSGTSNLSLLNPFSFFSNYSKTNYGLDANGNNVTQAKPPFGFQGQVIVPEGNYFTLDRVNDGQGQMINVKIQIPRASYIFHELQENYFRTQGNLPYLKAHQKAINTERKKNFGNPTPGEFLEFIFK